MKSYSYEHFQMTVKAMHSLEKDWYTFRGAAYIAAIEERISLLRILIEFAKRGFQYPEPRELTDEIDALLSEKELSRRLKSWEKDYFNFKDQQ